MHSVKGFFEKVLGVSIIWGKSIDLRAIRICKKHLFRMWLPQISVVLAVSLPGYADLYNYPAFYILEIEMPKDDIATIVAKNLKKARLARQMTQAEVAESADITPNHYARIERGESIPGVVTLGALLKGLKTKSSKILPF